MLTLRPTCENCNKPLPADSSEAMICSYECTFCTTCVQDVLENVCPNCGGGFVNRPIRPKTAWRPHVSLEQQPASKNPHHKPVDVAAHKEFSADIKQIPPESR